MKDSAANLIRTDLAIELRTQDAKACLHESGIRFRESEENGMIHSTLTVLNRRGEKALGKPKGNYITIGTGEIWLDDEREQATKASVVTRLLRRLVRKTCKQEGPFFVACLGNPAITADSLGPAVQNRLHISHHLEGNPLRSLFGRHALASLAPGVTGQTGIETVALIQDAIKRVSPALVIAVDALAARSPDRLCTTLQICNTGLAPGSGIGNRRTALNAETLGVPVIAIGVPTLVDSATLLSDALQQLDLDPASPIAESLLDPDRHFFVTRKETDLAVSILSAVIAESINRVAQE